MARGPGGFFTSLLGGMLLVAGGFLFGLVAGVVSEEPDLVVEHLAGGSEEVAWVEPAPPEVATAPPEAGSPEGEAGESAEAAPRAPEPLGSDVREPEPSEAEPEAAAPAPGQEEAPEAPAPAAGGFAVQVGAFDESAHARDLAGDLRGKGFESYVSAGPSAGRWRVRVGPVESREEADSLAARLKRDESLPTWVLQEGPR